MKKLIIALLVLLVIFGIGLQIFLKFALTETLAKHIIPVAEETIGVKIGLEHASVNLLRFSALLTGLSIDNPDGFKEPELANAEHFAVNLDIPALIRRRPIEVRQLRVKKAQLDIVRNSEGEINIRTLLRQIKKADQDTTPETEVPQSGNDAPEQPEDKDSAEEQTLEQEPQDKPSEPEVVEKLPPFMLRRATADITVRYIDHRVSPANPFVLTLESETNIRNLSSRQSDRQPPGKVEIHGTISTPDSEIPFKIEGLIDPITDPAMPTFEVEGEIGKINIATIEPYLEKTRVDIKTGAVSGQFSLICKDGVFDSSRSVFNLTFHDLTLSEERSRKMGGLTLPPKITAPVHIGGTLMEPKPDGTAIANAILSATLKELGAKNLPLDSDTIKDASSGTKKAIGGFFEKLRGQQDTDTDQE